MFGSGLNEFVVCPQYVWLWSELACCLSSVCLARSGLNEFVVCPQNVWLDLV